MRSSMRDLTDDPIFFASDTRRTDLAWGDWTAVNAFIADQTVCRFAVNDATWPYVVALAYRFDGAAFLLHFSRSGKLAACLRADSYCTIEISQTVSLLRAPNAQNTSAEYRSVIARCTAEVTELNLDAIDGERAPRRILAVRARVVSLSAKKRILDGAT